MNAMKTKTNKNKQVRLSDELDERVSRLVEISGFSESDVLRAVIRAGLPRLESGEVNPFIVGAQGAQKIDGRKKSSPESSQKG